MVASPIASHDVAYLGWNDDEIVVVEWTTIAGLDLRHIHILIDARLKANGVGRIGLSAWIAGLNSNDHAERRPCDLVRHAVVEFVVLVIHFIFSMGTQEDCNNYLLR